MTFLLNMQKNTTQIRVHKRRPILIELAIFLARVNQKEKRHVGGTNRHRIPEK